ncbi:MAG TPA: hypothetical protein VHR66_05155 [Gemmataceae bacterium]|jgi:uncharacterized repeat protein (TIGR01451 family)|nr:hypothetical protein [Gemmataceae bacterium]
MKPVARCVVALTLVSGCALLAGCLSGSPSYFPYLLPAGDPALQTHARPPGPGYFDDFDPHACRLVVRPELCTAPVRGSQVFIATVYDADGTPRRKRRVEWMVEGPGSIVEVDESGYLPGRGMKVDNKYAFSYTDYFEHCITRGKEEFTIRPGQTWCLVTSAVEGETTVIAYCPAINDWEKNRVYAKMNWVEGNLLFPAPVTARAGGDYTLNTTITRAGDTTAGYRVRYRIIDGPAAALTATDGGEVASVTEAVTVFGNDGSGRVNITQPVPTAGTNRIGIEVVKPDPDRPGQFTVVSKSETRVTWKSPKLDVTVVAPKSVSVGQDATVTYTLAGTEKLDSGPVTLTAKLPEGIDLVRTEPKAAIDGDTVIWTLPRSAGGKQQSVRATVRPHQPGLYSLSADARSDDGVNGSGSVAVTAFAGKVTPSDSPAPKPKAVESTEPQLALTIHGPVRTNVGQTVTWQIVVQNHEEAASGKIEVKATLPAEISFVSASDGGKASGRQVVWNLGSAPAGQERTITLTGMCNNAVARTAVTATITAQPANRGNSKPWSPAKPSEAVIEIAGVPALQMSVKDSIDPVPVGQRTTYSVRVKNAGTQVAKAIVITAEVPSESLRATRATGPGQTGKISEDKDKRCFTVKFPTVDTLAPNAELTFVVEAEALVPGDVRVKFEARSASQSQPLRAEEPTRILGKENRPFDR